MRVNMNSTAGTSGFQCPKGFIEEDDPSQIYLEDLDDDCEVWLVRLPSLVNPSVLEKQKIDLNKLIIVFPDNNSSYECVSEKCEMPNLSLIVPSKETKRLTRAKKTIKGSVFLYQTDEAQPEIKVEVNENKEEPADSFVKPKSKKHKERKENHAESELSSAMESINMDGEHLVSKKKSNKKKKSSVKVEPTSE